jgi:hypothetical protein
MSERYLRIQGGPRIPLDAVMLEAITRFQERFNTTPAIVRVPLCGTADPTPWYVQGSRVVGAAHLHFTGGANFTWQAEAGPAPGGTL